MEQRPLNWWPFLVWINKALSVCCPDTWYGSQWVCRAAPFFLPEFDRDFFIVRLPKIPQSREYMTSVGAFVLFLFVIIINIIPMTGQYSRSNVSPKWLKIGLWFVRIRIVFCRIEFKTTLWQKWARLFTSVRWKNNCCYRPTRQDNRLFSGIAFVMQLMYTDKAIAPNVTIVAHHLALAVDKFFVINGHWVLKTIGIFLCLRLKLDKWKI